MSTRKQMFWHFAISPTIPRHHLLQGRRQWRQLARWGFPWTGPCWLSSAPCTPEERISCWNVGIFISSNNSAKLSHFKFNSKQLLRIQIAVFWRDSSNSHFKLLITMWLSMSSPMQWLSPISLYNHKELTGLCKNSIAFCRAGNVVFFPFLGIPDLIEEHMIIIRTFKFKIIGRTIMCWTDLLIPTCHPWWAYL